MRTRNSWILFLFLGNLALSHSPRYSPDFIKEKSPITGRDFFDYLRRLGIPENEVIQAKGQKWLSVGEGTSNFTAESAKRGVDSQALDALVVNPHDPKRSRLGLAQNLPYTNEQFDRVVAVWLMDLFFSPEHFNDPDAGKKALQEMIRVVKIGGDIRISPIQQNGLLITLNKLKATGAIQYEVLPYYKGAFRTSGHHREFQVEPIEKGTPGSVRVIRLK